MKKLTKVLALVVVAAMLCLALASCGLSGKYEGHLYTLEFKGSDITIKGNVSKITAEGTYKIDGDKIIITLDNADDGAFSLGDTLNAFDGEHSFEKGDDYIKIDGVKYTKAD